MGRFLLLVVALLVLVWLVRAALGGRARRDSGPGQAEALGELVRCAHCGVHLPRAESRSAGSLRYCSEEHARLGPRDV